MLELSVLTFALLVLLLVFAILHRRHLNRISEQLAEGAADNGETLKHVVTEQNEATRRHISSEAAGIRHDTQLTKARMQHVFELMKKLAKFFGVTL